VSGRAQASVEDWEWGGRAVGMSDSSHGMSPADGVRYTRGVSAAMDSVRPAGGGKPGKRVPPSARPAAAAARLAARRVSVLP
jgi:hypothetical protein